MTEIVITHCDAEHGCDLYWRSSALLLPGSWVRTIRRVRSSDGESVVEREFHLCSRHRDARVRGQVGGVSSHGRTIGDVSEGTRGD